MEVTNVQTRINFSIAWEKAMASCTTAAICHDQSLNAHGLTPLLYSWAKRLLHLTHFFLVPAPEVPSIPFWQLNRSLPSYFNSVMLHERERKGKERQTQALNCSAVVR